MIRSTAGTAALLLAAIVCSADAPGGFDLGHNLIPRAEIRSGGPGKDGIPALTEPLSVDPGEVDYLADSDRVVGVSIGDEARAYPLRVLVWHEIANDIVGGKPIAVTYCPLCQSALVFDRQVGGKERTFGVSGLLYNSNVLMYDRQGRAREESLWSQGEMRAVTGPAAKDGLTLNLLPSELTTWADWRGRHPGTKVLSLDTGHQRPYRREAYAEYFATDRLMFPVEKRTKRPKGFADKELLAVVYEAYAARAYAVRDVKAAGGVLEDMVGSRPVRLVYIEAGDTVRVEAMDGNPPPAVAYMFWFALSAHQPGVEVYRPARP